MTQDEAFKAWWYTEGSQAPYTHHDCEEHTMRMCEIAWANGAYKEREALAQPDDPTGQAPCARHCEATAFQIVIKNLRGDIERMKAAQPAQRTKQKPVAWLVEFENGEQELHFDEQSVGEIHTPLYTHLPQRTEQEENKHDTRRN